MNTLAEFAAEIGPQLDRLRLGVMRASVEAIMKSGLLAGSGQHLETFTVFAMLRNAYPDRVVPVRNFQAAYVYQDPVKFETALFRMTGEELVEVGENESVALSAHGRRLMSQVRDVGAQAAEGLWGGRTLPVLQLADRCLVSAEATANADGAFRLVAPPHDEPNDCDATRLAERLTGLRWHRFDAHVAAWTAAGLTAESVADLSPGPERDEIEAQTNERAAQPYATLTSQERSALLDGLRGLA